eukprot:PhM_4_TR15977/c0_g1_i1/m.97965/K09680/coaW; type II pantothenate kinase
MPTTEVRFLSYNLNLLPLGSKSLGAGYKWERMNLFLDEHIEKYDIVALQEIFSSPILPSFASPLCRQHQLVAKAQQKGFEYSVRCQSPSYAQMAIKGKWTDSGLVILSRHKIVDSGTRPFTNQGSHIDRGATKGVMYARIRLPCTQTHVIVFNCHLQATHTTTSAAHYDVIRDDQLREMRVFMEAVLHRFDDPYIIVGDFNIDAMTLPAVGEQFGYVQDVGVSMPSRRYLHMMAVLDPHRTLNDLLLKQHGAHQSTRPPRLAFPASLEAISAHRYPQCLDYILASKSTVVKPTSAHVVRFLAPGTCPFEYLSDHFGVECTLQCEGSTGDEVASPRQARRSSLASSKMQSLYTWGIFFILSVLPFMLLFSSVLRALWCVVVYVVVSYRHRIWTIFVRPLRQSPVRFQIVPCETPGEKTTELLATPFRDVLELATVADNWERAVKLFGWLPCCGSRPIHADGTRGPYVFTSYKDVHIRATNFAHGLRHLSQSLTSPPTVAIWAENRRSWFIADLACSLAGIPTIPIPLGADAVFAKAVLKESRANIVLCTRPRTQIVLGSSDAIQLLVQMQAVEYAEQAQAAECDVKIASFAFVEKDGEAHPEVCVVPPQPTDVWSTWYEYSDSATRLTNEGILRATQVTHRNFMQCVSAVVSMGVLETHTSQLTGSPTDHRQGMYFSYLSLSHFHERVLHHAALYHGMGIGFYQGEMTRMYDDIVALKPTHLVALAGTLEYLRDQTENTKKRWTALSRALFHVAFQLQATLLHSQRRSPLLTTLFFNGFRRMLGGQAHTIIIPTVDEVSKSLIEFVSVCFQCRTPTITGCPSDGIIMINRRPAPDVPILTEERNEIPTLIVRGCPTDYVGEWGSETIDIHGFIDAMLWPVPGVSVNAVTLEREYQRTPLVQYIFVTNVRHKPLVAIVVPNRDNVDAWCRRHPSATMNSAVLDALKDIALQAHFPPMFHVTSIYLHVHPFAEHKDFLTSTGQLRRRRLNAYFTTMIAEMYEGLGVKTDSPLLPTVPAEQHPPLPECKTKFVAPCAVDIGGTCCKMAFFQPPHANPLPPYCYVEHKAAGVGHRFGRKLHFFVPTGSDVSFSVTPENFTGVLRFVKLPTSKVPDFIQYLHEQKSNVLKKYRPEDIRSIPATGGGAFKFKALIRNTLGVEINQLPEMSCAVRGLNFLLQNCPDEVFTLDWRTGEHVPVPSDAIHWPYLCVTIGSGISITKCLSPDGTYERIGGSTIGGGTFWGLVRLLTKATSWEDIEHILRCDGPGDERNVDLLVGDIYGFNAAHLPQGLRHDTIASTMGKIGATSILEGNIGVTPTSSDYIRSLLFMVASNITQIAYLWSRVHGVKNIFFLGGFVQNNPMVRQTISRTLEFWSGGEQSLTKGYFVRHDGYLGALGALIAETPQQQQQQQTSSQERNENQTPTPTPTPTPRSTPPPPNLRSKASHQDEDSDSSTEGSPLLPQEL